MSKFSLELFCNRIVANGRMTHADVRLLSEQRLADGLESRDEVDLLLALDRAVTDKDAGFEDLLVALVVDFSVWAHPSAGRIDRDTASWLTASIVGRSGPTRIGARIAMELVREAEASDDTLMTLALEANRWTRQPAASRPRITALAA